MATKVGYRSPDRYMPLHRLVAQPREVKGMNYTGIDIG